MADTNKATQNSAGAPRLEVLDRVKHIQVVYSAIEKTTYSCVKDSITHLLNWTRSYAETGLHYVTATAAPIAAPLAKQFKGQISAVDQELCEELDVVEKKFPIVKKPPQQIHDAAKAVMSSFLQTNIEKLEIIRKDYLNAAKASTLKESITKANELLSTQYGNMAVQGVDNTSVLVNRLLDHYFPPVQVEGKEDAPIPISADENKVLHALQTLGQLSTKTANRVYHSVAEQLKTVKKEDVTTYFFNVLSILHLTKFLGGEDDEKETNSPETNSPENKDEEKK